MEEDSEPTSQGVGIQEQKRWFLDLFLEELAPSTRVSFGGQRQCPCLGSRWKNDGRTRNDGCMANENLSLNPNVRRRRRNLVIVGGRGSAGFWAGDRGPRARLDGQVLYLPLPVVECYFDRYAFVTSYASGADCCVMVEVVTGVSPFSCDGQLRKRKFGVRADLLYTFLYKAP